jgi:hypothetical protein
MYAYFSGLPIYMLSRCLLSIQSTWKLVERGGLDAILFWFRILPIIMAGQAQKEPHHKNGEFEEKIKAAS